MKFTRSFIIAALVLGAATLGGCIIDFAGFNWDDYQYRFEDSYEAELADIETLTLEIRNGKISVETWDMDRVEIAIHERIKADDEEEAEELAETVRMVDDRSGDTLALEFDYGDLDRYMRKNYAAEIEVKLPARLNLSMRTTNGKIEIAAMEGDVEAHSTNGNIELDGCAGTKASTTNGAISIFGALGPVEAGTTNGSIAVHSLAGPVEAGTTNGKINVDVENPLEGDIDLRTTNGSISLVLHPDSSFEVDAGTTNGKVNADMPNSNFDYNKRKTSMDGRVGNGRYRVRLGTTNGGIRLESRWTDTRMRNDG